MILLLMIPVACTVLIAVAAWYARPSPERAMTEFIGDCRRAGLSIDEVRSQIAIREAFASLRRIASDECVARSGDYERHHINEVAKLSAYGLAAVYGKETAKIFIAWVDSCPDHEILYADARAARMRHGERYPMVMKEMSEDLKAAFTVE